MCPLAPSLALEVMPFVAGMVDIECWPEAFLYLPSFWPLNKLLNVARVCFAGRKTEVYIYSASCSLSLRSSILCSIGTCLLQRISFA